MRKPHIFDRRIAALVLLILVVAGYIFHNSMQMSAESHARSNAIVEQIKPILDPQNRITDKTFKFVVRKTAHFMEFGLIGVCLGTVSCCLTKRTGKKYFCMPLLLALLVAVTDEYIQSFQDRTSQVADVWLDFAGACFGIAIVFIVAALRQRRRIQRQKDAGQGD